jgi:hypothetical protein
MKEVLIMYCQRLIIPLLILSLVLTLSGCGGSGLTPTIPEGQENGVLYLEPANLTITPSKGFTVELKAAFITDLKGYSVTLFYDPALLSLQEAEEGTFLSAEGKTFFYKKVDEVKGIILIDCAILGPEAGVSGEGTLAAFSFASLKAGSTGIEFSLTRVRNTCNKEIITTIKNSLIRSE